MLFAYIILQYWTNIGGLIVIHVMHGKLHVVSMYSVLNLPKKCKFFGL